LSTALCFAGASKKPPESGNLFLYLFKLGSQFG
jgi:hypothetical protein